MIPVLCLSIVAALAPSCAGPPAEPPRAADHRAIVTAMLAAQPDTAEDRRRWIAQEPGEKSFLDSLLDYRLCVESRTFGRPQDFDASTISPAPGRAEAPGWGRSTRAFPIPPAALPPHLRRARSFSICPGGTIRLSNPRFTGDEARIFVEGDDSLGGWGAESILRKRDGAWAIVGTASRRQA